MKRMITLLVAAVLLGTQAYAQFSTLGSEKGNVKWNQVKTRNYRVVYPVGFDSLGVKYARELEYYRPLVGASAGYLPNQRYDDYMPIVLHPWSAVSNGAVVWGPRRMDIYTHPDAYGVLPPFPWEKLLAIHENRHVAQLQFSKDGAWRDWWYLFGELPALYVGSAYANSAMLEGDAVVAETALTPSGRGRTADFLSYYRMAFDNGDMRSWYRWRYGSQKYYTPDYYRVGYMTVAGVRYLYDEPVYMASYLHNLTSPFSFNALHKTTKKISGKKFGDTWEDITLAFKGIWADDDARRAPFIYPQPAVYEPKRFTAYSGMVAAGGKLYALKESLDKSQELVEIAEDASERFVKAFSSDSKLAYSRYSDRFYWAETIPDRRWDFHETSRIRSIRRDGRKVKDLTTEGHFVNPAVSADGRLLAAVEYLPEGGCRIVLFDLATSHEKASMSVPEDLQATEVAFLGADVAFAAISENGTGIYRTDFVSVSTLLEPNVVKIRDLISDGGSLVFTSDLNGTSEIYRLAGSALTRLTNTKYGVSSPCFMDGNLYVSALMPQGKILSKIPQPLNVPVSFADNYRYPIADALSAQEELLYKGAGKAIVSAPEKAGFASGLMRLHSWLPIYFNWDSFTATRTGYYYEVASPGAMAFFQSLDGTSSGSLGFSFHENPFVEKKVTAGAHLRYRYSGLWPVLDFSLDVGDRASARLTNAMTFSGDSSFVAAAPLNRGIYLGGAVKASVPLNFSSGGFNRSVVPYVTLSASNDVLGEYLAIYDDDTHEELQLDSYSNDSKTRPYRPMIWTQIGVSVSSERAVAPSQVFPKAGIGGDFKITVSSMNPFVYLGLYGYLPGFTNRQGIKLSLDAQAQASVGFGLYSIMRGMLPKYYWLPVDTWGLGAEDMSPRGFERLGAGGALLFFSDAQIRASVDYAAPILPVDFAAGQYIYLRNFELNPFADFTFNSSIFGNGFMYSAGADLVFRFEKLFMLQNTMKFYIRAAYNGGSGPLFESLGMKSPLYVGAGVSSPL